MTLFVIICITLVGAMIIKLAMSVHADNEPNMRIPRSTFHDAIDDLIESHYDYKRHQEEEARRLMHKKYRPMKFPKKLR